MIIKIRNKFFRTNYKKHLSTKKILKHNYINKSLLSIYIIHNYNKYIDLHLRS